MLMILRLVAFVDIALWCDRALRTFEEVRPICSAKPRSCNMRALLHPEEDDCEAPEGGWRNRGSKLRMQQELVRSTTGKGRLRTEKFSNTID